MQIGFGSSTAVVCSFCCIFWQVVIHPRMKLKMMLSKLLYVQFPFYCSSGHGSQESMTICTQIKEQETSASPGGSELGKGKARWACPCCTSIKLALKARGDAFELGPLASVNYVPNKKCRYFVSRVSGLYLMMPKSSRYGSPALRLNKLVNDVFSPMSSCRRDKQKSTGFIYIIMAWR